VVIQVNPLFKNFLQKEMLMNTMFTPAQLLRNWRQQRPSDQVDLDLTVTGKVWRVYYTGEDLFQFLYRKTLLLMGVL
jgi:hypothetical protein